MKAQGYGRRLAHTGISVGEREPRVHQLRRSVRARETLWQPAPEVASFTALGRTWEDTVIDPAPGFWPIFGPLGPTAGPGSPGNGPGFKNSAACTKKHPRRPIISPVRGHQRLGLSGGVRLEKTLAKFSLYLLYIVVVPLPRICLNAR